VPDVALRPGDRTVTAVLAIDAQTAHVVAVVGLIEPVQPSRAVVGLDEDEWDTPVGVEFLTEELGTPDRAVVHALGFVGADATQIALFLDCCHGMFLLLLARNANMLRSKSYADAR
jgi:hypothetical protein